MQFTLFYSRDMDVENVMHLKSDNIEVMTYNDPEEIMEELLELLLSRYQICLKTAMRGSDFIIDCDNLMYYKYHKTYFKGSSSYIDSLHWLKKKKKHQ